MNRITATDKKVRRLVLHTVLMAGAIIFALPFLWLFGTSCKVPYEMFPPRWIPQIPRRVLCSPYIALRDNERASKPIGVTRSDWNRLREPIRDAISERVVVLADQLPAFYGPHLKQRDLAEGIFERLLRRAPDDEFQKPDTIAVEWFVQNVTPELVGDVFETVYRRVAVSDVTFQGWDISVERPRRSREHSWEVVAGDAAIVSRTEGLRQPSEEVHYSFEKAKSFALQVVLPLDMAPQNLKRIMVNHHADRSWHEIWATVEMDGKRHEAAQAGFLGNDLWQETAWQFKSAEDRSMTTKTWLRIEEVGGSEFREPGKARITLEYRYRPHIMAVFNKYANNFREVLRIAPVVIYARNSLLLVVLNILGQVLASSLVAFSFARLRWPARDFCFVLVLATLMIPAQVTMIPLFLVFKTIGWYNTLRPLWVGAFCGSAFYIFLLRQFMRGIPTDLEDSAKIDGCGYLGIYWRIVLPLIKPALATIAIFTFLNTWNNFMGPLIYLSDQRLYPLSLGIFALQVAERTSYGLMMAATVLMTLPVIILFFVAQRYFVRGITLTGIKA